MIYTFSRRALRFICWLYIISGCVLLVSYLLPALYLPLIFLENGYLHLLLVFSDIVILKLIHLFFGYGNSTIIFIHTLGLGFLSLGILGIKSLMWIENHQKKGELVWFGGIDQPKRSWSSNLALISFKFNSATLARRAAAS